MRLVFGLFCVAALVALSAVDVDGHGYLAVPGARNSMWRLGFDTPKNYNDMALNCGGKTNQWDDMDGKCGLCGDPYQAGQPRDHEAGGKWVPVNRPISRCYNHADQVMDITVRITAHHLGYLEFRLCENNNMAADPAAECIDNGRLLTLAGTTDTRYDITTDVKEFYEFQLNIPSNVTCTQCILHWKYNSGNNWACDDTGCGMGMGPQEQFINCADIAILPDCEAFTSGTTGVTGGTTPAPTAGTTGWSTDGPTAGTTGWPTDGPTAGTTGSPSPCLFPCRSVGVWASDSRTNAWCNAICLNPSFSFCPPDYCQCD